jgi:hypothetical protein
VASARRLPADRESSREIPSYLCVQGEYKVARQLVAARVAYVPLHAAILCLAHAPSDVSAPPH